MGVKKLFLIKTHFVFMFRKMFSLIRVLWVSFFTSLFSLFGFIGRHILRLQGKLIAQNSMTLKQQECYTPEFVIEKGEEEEESKSLLRFRFPTFEEFVVNNDVHTVSDRIICDNSDGNCSFIESKIDTLSSKKGIVSKPAEDVVEPRISSENSTDMIGKYVNEIGEPQISSQNLGEMIVKLNEEIVEPQISSLKDVNGIFLNLKIDDSRRELMSAPIDVMEKNSEEIEIQQNMEDSNEMVDKLGNIVHNVRHENHFLSDDESLESDSDSNSMVSSNSSLRGSFIDSQSDGLLSDIDFQRAFEIDTLMVYGEKEVRLSNGVLTEEDIELQILSKGYGSDDFKDVDEDILQELKNIESGLENDTDSFDTKDGMNVENELLSDQRVVDENGKLEFNLVDIKNNLDIGDGMIMESKLIGVHQNLELNFVDDAEDEGKMDNELESKQDSEKSSSGEQLSSDSEEQNGLEREWEHQDLVEQLKMEIKNVRAVGLPTILEESESPKIMDDLKPWKIDPKFQHEDTLDELHKFYKIYRERMRKLDILNFQKMYAIGFLRLKDPLQSFSENKIPIPALAAIVSLNCWPCKPKSSSKIHPPLMKKFTRALESDLEMVYVSQMCLSWEFLCWEYGKALDIWESDPHGVRCYNEVANKFQMFQVLVTRFLENEPFQGPRVQHYVKDRCVLRNLLQVPVIRDDNNKDRKKERKVINNKDAITSLQLVEIIEESIRILWKFIRTDKDSSNPTLLKYRRSSNVELQSPVNASLYTEVRSTLEKKDKKLKELTRSENCILRNFRKHPQDDGSDNVLYFFSRVDMKLVSRVLNMSRISTEQLVWCSDKLNKINIVGRQIQVEPSILLFPCS